MPSKEVAIQRLLSFLFWVFLLSTAAFVIFFVVVPTADEWPGTFPYDIELEDLADWKFYAPFIRHLSLFPEHFSVTTFINIINAAFLTMFIYKIGEDVREGRTQDGDGNGGLTNPIRIPNSKYVEWAMGALFSGIIFASARISTAVATTAVLYLISIFVFSFVTLYFLYDLRKKLRIEERKSKFGKNNEALSNGPNGDFD